MAIKKSPQMFAAVFCGSHIGNNPKYANAAQDLGFALVEAHIGLVFGGGKVGLMGTVADSVMANGGEVYGYIPHFLSHKEVEHESVTQIVRVETMHERKALMADKANAFIALPGGFGTYDELFEIITWAQLSLHKKPICILNTDGFFDHLIKFIERAVNDGFISRAHRDMIFVSHNVKDIVQKCKTTVS